MELKTSLEDIEEMYNPLTLDLIAYYKMLQDDVLKILYDSSEDKNLEDIIHEIDKLF